jgi:hypothetical protein
MKVERRDGSSERAVLSGMITSKAVLRGIAARIKPDQDLFASRWSDLIAGWCVQHYRKYGKAPGQAVERYFDRWAATNKDEDTIRLVEKFLQGMSREYERKAPASAEFILDLAGRHFLKVQIRQLKEELEGKLENDEVEEAAKKLSDFRKIEIGSTSGIWLLEEVSAVKAAFEAKSKPIICSGQKAADLFFSHSLAREEFIAFMGKAKVGKSFFLQELSWWGVRNKKRVAFFEVGDQSQHQLIRRMGARAKGIPIWVDEHPVRIPKSIASGQPPEIDWDEKVFKKEISWQQSVEAFKSFSEKYGQKRLFLSVHPNSSMTVTGIETILGDLEQQSRWVPDVVIIDYADLLAPMDGKLESRDQINANWKAMRRINQRLHCLMVTATQSDAASYDTDLLRRRNFTDDRRKFDQVTGMIGINQTDTEKREGRYRLNWILGRDLDFAEDQCLHCASCLPLGNPIMASTFA